MEDNPLNELTYSKLTLALTILSIVLAVVGIVVTIAVA